MTEDDIYRASTQYRLWSYTPESLASLRHSTNAVASQRVRAAIKRARESQPSSATALGHNGGVGPDGGSGGDQRKAAAAKVEMDIQCLTVEEELKLVGYYCVKCMGLSDFCSFPSNVKATAVQYLKRFYLSNSPMTYHPKSIMPCALFLATKTENHYTPLKAFAGKVPKTTPEDVIAPEFVITQGLRFTFDVRHPFRALEGGFMELVAIADDKARALGLDDEAFRDLPRRTSAQGSSESAKAPPPRDLHGRIRAAHAAAKGILKTSAQLSDAYFMYTPSQIWLAALYMVDEPLARAYLDCKFPGSSASSSGGAPNRASTDDVEKPSSPSSSPSARAPQEFSSLKIRLISTIHHLTTTLLSSQGVAESLNPTAEYIAELKRIDKKLYTCRNPERMDLVEWNQSLRHRGKDKGDEEEAEEEEEEGEDDDDDKAGNASFGKETGKPPTKERNKKTNRDRGASTNADDIFGGPLK